MRRQLLASFLALLLGIVPLLSPLAVLTVSAQASEPQLVVNGGFEEGLYAPTNYPTGWDHSQFTQNGAQFTWVKDVVHSGSKAVKISAAQPDDARWTQSVAVQPQTRYLLSGWIKTSNVALPTLGGAGANLSVESSSEPFLGRSEERFADTDWSYVHFTFSSGEANQVLIMARLGHYGGINTGTAWFDDIVLAPLTLPLNAGFEEGVFAPTASPTDWTLDLFAPSALLTWDNQVLHSGLRSVKIAAPERNQASWLQMVAIQPQSSYRLSGWIKTESVAHTSSGEDAGANLSIMGVQTRLASAVHSPALFGTNDWTQVQVNFNSGQNSQAIVEAQIGHPFGLTSGSAWFDDLRLERISNSNIAGDPVNGITLRLRASEYQLTQDQEGVERIAIDGFDPVGLPGDPLLPSKDYWVGLPPDVVEGSVQVTLLDVVQQAIAGSHAITPAPPYIATPNGQTIIDWGENAGTISNGRNSVVYDNNAFFPTSPVVLRAESQMRKWRFVTLQFTPMQYNPVTKQLQFVSEVIVHLTFALTSVRAAETEALLADSVLDSEAAALLYNFAQAQAWYPQVLASAASKPGYAIITTNEIVANSAKLNDFVAYKQAAGYEVTLITETHYGKLSGQAPNGRAEKIRRWLIDNYVSKQIEAVLLIGDPNPDDPSDTPDDPVTNTDIVGDLPMKMCWPRRIYTDTDTTWQQAPTDYFYADLTGNWDKDDDRYFGEYYGDLGAGGVDVAPEVFVGRIPVYRTRPTWQTELDSILNKLMAYQSSSDTAWRRSALLAMAIDGNELAEALRNDFFVPLGVSGYRMYEADSSASCNNIHDYPTDQALEDKSVRDYWKDHPTGLVLWAGHGWANGTLLCKGGSLIHSDDALQLNDAKPAFTYQMSCETGWPESATNMGVSLLDCCEFQKEIIIECPNQFDV